MHPSSVPSDAALLLVLSLPGAHWPAARGGAVGPVGRPRSRTARGSRRAHGGRREQTHRHSQGWTRADSRSLAGTRHGAPPSRGRVEGREAAPGLARLSSLGLPEHTGRRSGCGQDPLGVQEGAPGGAAARALHAPLAPALLRLDPDRRGRLPGIRPAPAWPLDVHPDSRYLRQVAPHGEQGRRPPRWPKW